MHSRESILDPHALVVKVENATVLRKYDFARWPTLVPAGQINDLLDRVWVENREATKRLGGGTRRIDRIS